MDVGEGFVLFDGRPSSLTRVVGDGVVGVNGRFSFDPSAVLPSSSDDRFKVDSGVSPSDLTASPDG